MTPRDQASMRQMRDHAVEAQQLARGRTRNDLDADRVFQLAITRLLEIVGEASGRVGEATRDQHPSIAWSQIVGLRNRLIHGYDEVDCDILWKIVDDDLPRLIAELNKIVSNA